LAESAAGVAVVVAAAPTAAVAPTEVAAGPAEVVEVLKVTVVPAGAEMSLTAPERRRTNLPQGEAATLGMWRRPMPCCGLFAEWISSPSGPQCVAADR
jgi:hypothetical protein